MIELPEAATLARQAQQSLVGRTITRVQAGKSPHKFAFFAGDPAEYPASLIGRTLTGACSYGMWVELEAGGQSLLFNDGVNLRHLAPGVPEPAKHQLYLSFDDGSALSASVQMYGALYLQPTGDMDNKYYRVAREKPAPLTDAFDRAYFDALVAAVPGNQSAKALLATKQRIPGLGNGCLQDILFAAGVNPQSRLDKLTPADYDALYSSVKTVLAVIAEKGGRDTEKDLFGVPGGYATKLSAKTAAYACPHCSGSILRKAYMGGNVYFCPTCQPLKK